MKIQRIDFVASDPDGNALMLHSRYAPVTPTAPS